MARDPTRLLTGTRCDDFCLIHGYKHMRSEIGNPIPFCEACERETEEKEHGRDTRSTDDD